MYEYEFVRIDLQGVFKKAPKEDYREVIRERGKNGWRLVQIVAPGVMMQHGILIQFGSADQIELIFEWQAS